MPLDLARIQLICFDVDGTLRDTDDQYVQRLSGWLSPFRFLLPGRDPARMARRLVLATESPATILHRLPDRIGIDGALARLDDLLHHEKPGKNAGLLPAIQGVPEFLALLHDRYQLAVVSARSQRTTLVFLDQLGLTHLFCCIATAQTCRHAKPYPDQILWAAKQIGISPTNCLMVGDTTIDIQAGIAAGAQTIGVLCGFGEEAELRDAGADMILNSTPDLAAILL